MRQAQINVRTRACSRTSIARTKQAALTHNVRGKELNTGVAVRTGHNLSYTIIILILKSIERVTFHLVYQCQRPPLPETALGVRCFEVNLRSKVV